MVESNKEHGEGRSDVAVLDSRGGRAAVFEAKYVKTPDRMEEACHEAIEQIEEKDYAARLREEGMETILAYGVACFRKQCRVKLKKV